MLFKVIFAVIIMSVYILFFDSNIDTYYDTSILERSVFLVKSIVISGFIYFLSLYLFGVRLKQL